MSNTRRAEKDSPFRQERYASSAEFERGLLGNLVAKRCELIRDPQDRELVWWLQLCSWQEGGLEKMAPDLLAQFPGRVACDAMHKFGFKPGQRYGVEKIKALRLDIPKEFIFEHTCRGETYIGDGTWYDCPDNESGQKNPVDYPASDFVAMCRKGAESLSQTLAEICLDPAIKIADGSPWYFSTLIETLREVMASAVEKTRAAQVVTALGAQVHETLDFALEAKKMVVIDGLARTGKTFSAKSWCELHPGQARYVQVPSSNDDIGFFRAIARALGVSINQNSKAQQLRDRIEDVLQRSRLAVVFDEAHYLWPQGNYRAALPSRLNWVMTALSNQGVPVGLVTTPQFMQSHLSVEAKAYWSGAQLTGRIGHYEKLPDLLSDADLNAVAKSCLPDGCAKTIEALVMYAKGSTKYLAAIEAVVCRAQFLAKKAGRTRVAFGDVKTAILGSVVPSDKALAAALADPKKAGRSRAIKAPLEAVSSEVETPLQDRSNTAPTTRAGTGTRKQDLAALGLGADRNQAETMAA